jgi:uncharacterized integral membrane protein
MYAPVKKKWLTGQAQSLGTYDIYLLTAIGLTPGGSSTVHIYTQTIHRTKQLTKWEESGPCPFFVRYNPAFALQMRKKHGKNLICGNTDTKLRSNVQTVKCRRLRLGWACG